MTVAAQQFVEQFKQLSDADKREVVEAIAKEVSPPSIPPVSGRRKTIAEVAGKFRSAPTDVGEDLDESFVKAIWESKGR